ncbi:STAS domain-containing protein [Sediminibacterium salmoneum]|uniref:STAS domain-containing protein n=1 Tax=Sediminibacterium salmoneum TaxID=426421 RepID=UPI00047CB806|nr:STAS domain-containing protein [Sediminibacterium salmoneum]
MLNVKIDTKEKFTVLNPETTHISANMSETLLENCRNVLNSQPKNLILNLSGVNQIDAEVAESLTEVQQLFYEKNASFVVCNIDENLEQALDQQGLLEIWNITPTESEAWDIVQMEEIERELLDSDDISFENHPEEPA